MFEKKVSFFMFIHTLNRAEKIRAGPEINNNNNNKKYITYSYLAVKLKKKNT